MRPVTMIFTAALLVAGGAQAAAPVEVKLLAINDFHGNLEPPAGGNGRIGGVEAGGAEYLAAHLSAALKADPDAVIVAAGDMISASPLLSGLFHDEPAVEALNAMKLAVTSVGNHEFDEGWTELLRMQNGGCGGPDAANKCRGGPFPGAAYTYLSANVVHRAASGADAAAVAAYNAGRRAKARAHAAICARPANKGLAACRVGFNLKLKPEAAGATLLPPYVVRTINGVKVGFIGETLKGTPTIVSPAGVADLAFLDEADTANRYARELKAQGVNTIVLLIHEGGQQSNGADYNGCVGFTGAIVPILERLTPDIGVVISAHTHNAYNCTINGRLVTSGAAFGRLITHVTLSVDPQTGKLLSASARNTPVTRDVPKDPTQTALIDKYKALAAPIANRVVGAATRTIGRTQNKAGESAMGDLLADAQLASASAADKGGAVIAFMNPGGVRADLPFDKVSGGEKPGEVTYGELFEIQPFSNTVTVLTLTGAQLKALLEQQFDSPTPGEQRFLQISKGFTYSYRLNAPAGQHVDPASMTLNGVTIDPARTYRTAQNNFIAAGGDNFTVFTQGKDQLGGDLDVDALVAWFQAHSPVEPPAIDRIVRLD